jgi:hypothetical protein
MLETALGLLLVVPPVLGVLARRWFVLLIPLIAWPVYFAGLNKHWWGYGTGDGWLYAAAVFSVVGILITAAAIGLARGLRPRFRHSIASGRH